jgi:hypothetical protein
VSEFQEVGDIIDRVYAFAKAEDWTGLDEYVRTYDYAFETELNVIAVLRSSFALRAKLIYWQDAVARARGIHGDESFSGLF